MEMAPLETMSPTTASVPPVVVVIALPAMPPHPAWLRAAIVGVYSRLFTPPEPVAESRGMVPLVRMRANASAGDLEAEIGNWAPAAARPAPLLGSEGAA